MKKRKIVFVEDSFSLESGGRITSIFRRAKLFSEMGYDVAMTAFNFRGNYPIIFRKLCKKHNVKNFEFISLYDYFAESSIYEVPDDIRTVEDLGIMSLKKTEEKKYEGSVAGKRYVINVRSNRTITTIEVFENGKKLYKDTCGASGHTLRRTQFVNENGIEIIEHYFSLDGHEYLRIEYYETKGSVPKRDRCSSCVWYKRDGEKVALASPYELISRWIKYIDDRWDGPLFFSEYRYYDSLIINQLDNLKGRIVATIHGPIFDEPYTFGSPIKEYIKVLTDRIDKYDAVITLTPQAKEDIERLYGKKPNIHVIPHPLEFNDEIVNQKKEKNTITLCTRLMRLKRVDMAIDAIAIVKNNIPEITLNVFGMGEEYDGLQSQIKRLRLEDTVFLKGFTDEPIKEIAKAELTLLLSEYEGLSLSLVESLAAGTPAITFDFKYGPKAVIKNGYNGHIVQSRDVNELADRIEKTLKRRIQLKIMSKNSKKVKKQFSQAVISKKWDKLFEELG